MARRQRYPSTIYFRTSAAMHRHISSVASHLGETLTEFVDAALVARLEHVDPPPHWRTKELEQVRERLDGLEERLRAATPGQA